MSETAAPDATARLDRLDRYLQQDPSNATLLADACETAIACGAHERAEAYLRAGEALGRDGDAWAFRRARLCIARRDLGQAAALLGQLHAAGVEHAAVIHDLAYVRFLQQDFAGCRALLEPWLTAPAAGAADIEAVQVLWLRATHHIGLLEPGAGWARAAEAAGTLAPAAQGVASLLALDLGDFETARRWADAALAADAAQLEALVARGCVALAEGDAGRATQLLQAALQQQPEGGRIWSALGYASLHAGQLALARSQLERAVRTMDGHVGTWHALGWACLLLGDGGAARAAFERALALDRNFAESHGALGLVLGLAGEDEQARHHLDVADRLDARNVTGRYARALLAGDARDRRRLEQLARQWLDRPGFFGGTLAEAVISRTARRR